ncbi:hypothetical protein MKW92_019506, partial [Papaver armeniacum]
EGSQFTIANASDQDFGVAEISVHPRHMKQMKPHQIEGFNFLLRNLVCDRSVVAFWHMHRVVLKNLYDHKFYAKLPGKISKCQTTCSVA